MESFTDFLKKKGLTDHRRKQIRTRLKPLLQNDTGSFYQRLYPLLDTEAFRHLAEFCMYRQNLDQKVEEVGVYISTLFHTRFQSPDIDKEKSERIRAITQATKAISYMKGMKLYSVSKISKKKADKWIDNTHSMDYLEKLRQERDGDEQIDKDTIWGEHTYASCRLYMSMILKGFDDVRGGTHSRIFVAGRPPGHHCGKYGGTKLLRNEDRQTQGFCSINYAAVLTKYALHYDYTVFVYDFDVHHGNGTQAILSKVENAFYISTHRCDDARSEEVEDDMDPSHDRHSEGEEEDSNVCYPGTGSRSYGNILNLPCKEEELSWDWLQRQLPAMSQFIQDNLGEKNLLIFSAGFDAAEDDPTGYGTLHPRNYKALTERVITMFPSGTPVVSILEGGYLEDEDQFEPLRTSIMYHLRGLRFMMPRQTS